MRKDVLARKSDEAIVLAEPWIASKNLLFLDVAYPDTFARLYGSAKMARPIVANTGLFVEAVTEPPPTVCAVLAVCPAINMPNGTVVEQNAERVVHPDGRTVVEEDSAPVNAHMLSASRLLPSVATSASNQTSVVAFTF